MRLAVVIPALNEEQTVGSLVQAGAVLGDVIVVDDGSSDSTSDVARGSGATVVLHAWNQGYDRALASGFAAAAAMGADAIVTMDADGQHHLDDVRLVSAAVTEDRVELSLGTRRRTARWSETAFNRYTTVRFGVTDILCGVKAFSMDLYLRHPRVVATRSIGTALALAGLRERVPHVSVPVSVLPRQGGPSRFGRGLRADGRILVALAEAVARDVGNLAKP